MSFLPPQRHVDLRMFFDVSSEHEFSDFEVRQIPTGDPAVKRRRSGVYEFRPSVCLEALANCRISFGKLCSVSSKETTEIRLRRRAIEVIAQRSLLPIVPLSSEVQVPIPLIKSLAKLRVLKLNVRERFRLESCRSPDPELLIVTQWRITRARVRSLRRTDDEF